jgi:Ca-activated chloride channel family protein
MALTPGHLELLAPHWLWLLPALAGIALAWRALGRDRPAGPAATSLTETRLAVHHPLLGLLRKTAGVPPQGRHRLATGLVNWLILACLVLALAQPVRVGTRLPEPPQERDIVFIIDTGLSMILRDYVIAGQRIDRLNLLKGLLDEFVARLQAERLSVIIFGEAAYTLVPFTRDHALVQRMLGRLRTTLAGRFAAMGEAIALAVRQARDAPGRRRVLVLFSSANQTTGGITPAAAARLAAEAGIPLYTVAIGAATRAAEEQRPSGLIYQPVDRELLAALARQTGARSYLAGDPAALQRAIADIDQRETNTTVLPPRYILQPLYLWPLLAGLTLLSLSQLLRILRRRTA